MPSINAPANFDYANFIQLKLGSAELTAGLSFAQPERTYVKVWYLASDGSRQQLAFVRLDTLKAMDVSGSLLLEVPRGATVQFESYDASQTTGIREIQA